MKKNPCFLFPTQLNQLQLPVNFCGIETEEEQNKRENSEI